MKKIFVAALSLFSLATFAQLELKKLDGTPINNGDVFEFTALSEPDAYLGLKIYNTTDEDIMIKAQVVSIVNSTGTNLQLCVGDVCLLSVTAGSIYPNFPAVIPANGENGNFDHFVNYNGGIDPTQPVEYTIRILMVDDFGQEIGNSIQFTYRYLSELSVDSHSLANMGVNLKSTVVADQISLIADADVELKVYDMNGKLAVARKLVAGESSVDVSLLSSGVYVAKFTNSLGRQASAKIVKR